MAIQILEQGLQCQWQLWRDLSKDQENKRSISMIFHIQFKIYEQLFWWNLFEKKIVQGGDEEGLGILDLHTRWSLLLFYGIFSTRHSILLDKDLARLELRSSFFFFAGFDMLNSSSWLQPSMLLGKTVGCLSLSQANTVSGICYTINVKCKVEGHKFLELYFNLNSLTDPSMTLIIHHPAGRLSHIRGVFFPFSIKNEA